VSELPWASAVHEYRDGHEPRCWVSQHDRDLVTTFRTGNAGVLADIVGLVIGNDGAQAEIPAPLSTSAVTDRVALDAILRGQLGQGRRDQL